MAPPPPIEILWCKNHENPSYQISYFKGDNLQNQSNTKKSLQISFSDQKASAGIFSLHSNFFVFFSGHVYVAESMAELIIQPLNKAGGRSVSISEERQFGVSAIYRSGYTCTVCHLTFYRSVFISKKETVRMYANYSGQSETRDSLRQGCESRRQKNSSCTRPSFREI